MSMAWSKQLAQALYKRRKGFLVAIICFPVFLQQCTCRYGLSGVNIPPDISTLSVKYFPNEAALVTPTLSQSFTEKLKDKFLKETRLSIVPPDGDFQLSGVINTYKIEPVAITSNTGTSKNRLTIGAKVEFRCPKHKEVEFTETISNYAEFDATQNFQSLEKALIEDITQRMVQDIFNRVALQW